MSDDSIPKVSLYPPGDSILFNHDSPSGEQQQHSGMLDALDPSEIPLTSLSPPTRFDATQRTPISQISNIPLNLISEETFEGFLKVAFDMDNRLIQFTREARQIGQSVGILHACHHLRHVLVAIVLLFYKNALHLFPSFDRRHQSGSRTTSIPYAYLSKRSRHVPFIQFPRALSKMGEGVKILSDRILDFHEYTDLTLLDRLSHFRDLANYRSTSLKPFMGGEMTKYHYEYIHRICVDMAHSMEEVNAAIDVFIQIGLPTIRHEQQRISDSLYNTSTVATFFSAVTSSVLQVSFGAEQTPTVLVVNTLWFCSLVFSIGAALNSLLSLSYTRTSSSSRGIPLWVSIWMSLSPMAFLVISIITFLGGLILFTFASGQIVANFVITTASTFVTLFGLGMVLLWMFYQRGSNSFIKRGGDQIDQDVWSADDSSSLHLGYETRTRDSPSHAEHSKLLPTTAAEFRVAADILGFTSRLMSNRKRVPFKEEEEELSPIINLPPPMSPRERWKETFSRIREIQTTIQAFTPAKGDKHLTSNPQYLVNTRGVLSEQFKIVDIQFSPDGRYIALALASSRQDRATPVTTIYSCKAILDNGSSRPDIPPINIRHSDATTINQVEWSPDGRYILIRLGNCIDLFEMRTRINTRVYNGLHPITSVRWDMDSNFFVYTHLHFITQQSCIDKKRRCFSLSETSPPDFVLRDLAVSNLGRFIALGYRPTPPGAQFPAEVRVIVLAPDDEKAYENQNWTAEMVVPLLDDVRSLLLARDGWGPGLLLGHHDKLPPAEWDLVVEDSAKARSVHIRRQGHFQTDDPLHSWGPPVYDKDGETFVLCATEGSVYIWDDSRVITDVLTIDTACAKNIRLACSKVPEAMSAARGDIVFAVAHGNKFKICQWTPPSKSPLHPSTLRQASPRLLERLGETRGRQSEPASLAGHNRSLSRGAR